MNKKKRILIKLSVCLSVIVFVVLYFISPRQIIKRTVMRYERDFTIPVFCRQIRFEYDIKTGSYCGKFEISKRQADKILEKLNYLYDRSYVSLKKKPWIDEKNVQIIDSNTLNSTLVWNWLLLEDKEKNNTLYNREDINSADLFEESWLAEADAEILAIYEIYADKYLNYTLYQYDGKERDSFVTVYKNKQNKYYISIKHVVYTELEDWGGPNLKWNKNT
ncbi:hypothetical protein [Lachnospira hominis (ex Liu et al. 2021)]|uniref:DUF3139 domain-containing protein n=1 Tax=Lachnospira hominis (ex Liu et al. 2021) TaxID=2763051 RepID=A0ABR7G0P5_9FIRM|nr:hypothetical protein [Lachnospira hominis]MBC5680311.1 hypothetical protein [Lachnospira hominis]